MKIDYPSQQELPQLRLLWQEAFGDDDGFLDLFFSTAFSPDRCQCVQIDGQIAGALYWMDCRLDGSPMAYLYAVATAKAFRHRGICRALMERTHKLLRELGYAGILLVPGNDSLRRMYASLGYQDGPASSLFSTQAGEAATPLRPISGEEYIRMRRERLPQGSVLQESCPGFLEGCYRLYAGENCLLAATHTDDALVCSEYLGDIACAPSVLTALGKDQGTFRIPGEDVPFAMHYPLSGCPKPQYFAFAFD